MARCKIGGCGIACAREGCPYYEKGIFYNGDTQRAKTKEEIQRHNADDDLERKEEE